MSILSVVRLKYLTRVLKTGKQAAAKIAGGVKLLASGACKKVELAWMRFAQKTPISRLVGKLNSGMANNLAPALTAVRSNSRQE